MKAKQQWTAFEDARLVESYKTNGDKWSIIAAGLSGREPIECMKRCRELQAMNKHIFDTNPNSTNVNTTTTTRSQLKSKNSASSTSLLLQQQQGGTRRNHNNNNWESIHIKTTIGMNHIANGHPQVGKNEKSATSGNSLIGAGNSTFLHPHHLALLQQGHHIPQQHPLFPLAFLNQQQQHQFLLLQQQQLKQQRQPPLKKQKKSIRTKTATTSETNTKSNSKGTKGKASGATVGGGGLKENRNIFNQQAYPSHATSTSTTSTTNANNNINPLVHTNTLKSPMIPPGLPSSNMTPVPGIPSNSILNHPGYHSSLFDSAATAGTVGRHPLSQSKNSNISLKLNRKLHNENQQLSSSKRSQLVRATSSSNNHNAYNNEASINGVMSTPISKPSLLSRQQRAALTSPPDVFALTSQPDYLWSEISCTAENNHAGDDTDMSMATDQSSPTSVLDLRITKSFQENNENNNPQNHGYLIPRMVPRDQTITDVPTDASIDHKMKLENLDQDITLHSSELNDNSNNGNSIKKENQDQVDFNLLFEEICHQSREEVEQIYHRHQPQPHTSASPNSTFLDTINHNSNTINSNSQNTHVKGLSAIIVDEVTANSANPNTIAAIGSSSYPLFEGNNHLANGIVNFEDENNQNQNSFRWELEQLWHEHASLLTPEERSMLAPVSQASNRLFDDDQLRELQTQIQQNFQLMTQAYVIQREVHGKQHGETFWWEQKLRESAALDYCCRLLGTGPDSMFAIPGVQRVPEILGLNSFHPSSDRTKAFKNIYNNQISIVEKRRQEKNLKENSSSVLSGLRRQEKRKLLKIAPWTESLEKVILMFRDLWDPALFPRIVPLKKNLNNPFSEYEDQLVFYGVRLFGFEDAKSIRAMCLPTRKLYQISSRIKALTGRHAKDNPVKTLYLMPFKPMNVFEQYVLSSGGSMYGPMFKDIATQLFSQYPQTILKTTWNRLHLLGELPCSWDTPINGEEWLSGLFEFSHHGTAFKGSSTKANKNRSLLRVSSKENLHVQHHEPHSTNSTNALNLSNGERVNGVNKNASAKDGSYTNTKQQQQQQTHPRSRKTMGRKPFRDIKPKTEMPAILPLILPKSFTGGNTSTTTTGNYDNASNLHHPHHLTTSNQAGLNLQTTSRMTTRSAAAAAAAGSSANIQNKNGDRNQRHSNSNASTSSLMMMQHTLNSHHGLNGPTKIGRGKMYVPKKTTKTMNHLITHEIRSEPNLYEMTSSAMKPNYSYLHRKQNEQRDHQVYSPFVQEDPLSLLLPSSPGFQTTANHSTQSKSQQDYLQQHQQQYLGDTFDQAIYHQQQNSDQLVHEDLDLSSVFDWFWSDAVVNLSPKNNNNTTNKNPSGLRRSPRLMMNNKKKQALQQQNRNNNIIYGSTTSTRNKEQNEFDHDDVFADIFSSPFRDYPRNMTSPCSFRNHKDVEELDDDMAPSSPQPFVTSSPFRSLMESPRSACCHHSKPSKLNDTGSIHKRGKKHQHLMSSCPSSALKNESPRNSFHYFAYDDESHDKQYQNDRNCSNEEEIENGNAEPLDDLYSFFELKTPSTVKKQSSFIFDSVLSSQPRGLRSLKKGDGGTSAGSPLRDHVIHAADNVHDVVDDEEEEVVVVLDRSKMNSSGKRRSARKRSMRNDDSMYGSDKNGDQDTSSPSSSVKGGRRRRDSPTADLEWLLSSPSARAFHNKNLSNKNNNPNHHQTKKVHSLFESSKVKNNAHGNDRTSNTFLRRGGIGNLAHVFEMERNQRAMSDSQIVEQYHSSTLRNNDSLTDLEDYGHCQQHNNHNHDNRHGVELFDYESPSSFYQEMMTSEQDLNSMMDNQEICHPETDLLNINDHDNDDLENVGYVFSMDTGLIMNGPTENVYGVSDIGTGVNGRKRKSREISSPDPHSECHLEWLVSSPT